jgi:hypothetical protein
MMLQHDWNSSHIHLCKAKAVPVHVIMAYLRVEINSTSLNLASRWGWLVSFSPSHLTPKKTTHSTYQIVGKKSTRANTTAVTGINLSSVIGIEPCFVSYPSHSLVLYMPLSVIVYMKNAAKSNSNMGCLNFSIWSYHYNN